MRLPPRLLAALDRYIKEDCPEGTTRPEAIRMQFTDWAIGHGYLPADDAD